MAVYCWWYIPHGGKNTMGEHGGRDGLLAKYGRWSIPFHQMRDLWWHLFFTKCTWLGIERKRLIGKWDFGVSEKWGSSPQWKTWWWWWFNRWNGVSSHFSDVGGCIQRWGVVSHLNMGHSFSKLGSWFSNSFKWRQLLVKCDAVLWMLNIWWMKTWVRIRRPEYFDTILPNLDP